MLKSPLTAVLVLGAALSIWVGAQLLGRDWLAWVFLLGIPLLCLAVFWWRARARKSGGAGNAA